MHQMSCYSHTLHSNAIRFPTKLLLLTFISIVRQHLKSDNGTEKRAVKRICYPTVPFKTFPDCWHCSDKDIFHHSIIWENSHPLKWKTMAVLWFQSQLNVQQSLGEKGGSDRIPQLLNKPIGQRWMCASDVLREEAGRGVTAAGERRDSLGTVQVMLGVKSC